MALRENRFFGGAATLGIATRLGTDVERDEAEVGNCLGAE